MNRILFISHEATQTGASIALLHELEAIKAKCSDVKCEVLLLSGGQLIDNFRRCVPTHMGWHNETLFVRALRFYGCDRAIRPWLYACNYKQYDTFYANTVSTFKVAVELKKRYGIPLIGHVHEAENLMNYFGMTREIMQSFDKLIAVSELTKKNLIDLYNVPSEQITIQHPSSLWVSKAIEQDTAVHRQRGPEHIPTIGVISNGGWWKGTELIPVAISHFFRNYPDSKCRFVIAGSIGNETMRRLKYELRETGVSDNVSFIGFIDNPLDFFQTIDIFLLLSREESYSLVATEAAYMEVPVVGFNHVTGAEEWLKDGAGLFVPYLDFDKLSEALYKLSKDNNLRNRIAIIAKEKIMKMYFEDLPLTNIIKAITP